MKNWEALANKHIKTFGIDVPTKQVKIIEMWKVFADTGVCNDIVCNVCPFNDTEQCVRSKKNDGNVVGMAIEYLNKEEIVMKEVKEWNGKPREMWVWNDDENQKEKRFVIFIEPSSNVFPYIRVITWDALTGNMVMFKHCAEIEEQLMTHKELAQWLREKTDREYKFGDYENVNVHSVFVYGLRMECEPVDKNIYVREGYGEWEKPLKSLLYKNWNYGKEFGED